MMNLADFTLLKEDAGSYTVGHPKGKSIRVAKHGLSTKAQEVISKLKRTQNMDEGGTALKVDLNAKPPSPEEVQQASQAAPAQGDQPYGTGDTQFGTNAPISTPVPNSSDVINQSQAAPANGGASADWNAPAQAGIPASAEVTNPAPAAAPQTGAFPDNTAGLNTAKEAQQGAAKAEQAEATSNTKAMADYLAAASKVPTAQETQAKYQKQSDNLVKAITSNKIDPRRYVHNMNTPSKIASGIAMLISGIGSGLSGQPNMAIKVMNDAIDKDIDAQKNDQSKNMSLWKMNRENMNSEVSANLATKEQLLSTAKAQMMQAAATAQGPVAQAKYAAAILPLDQQLAQMHWMQSIGGGQSHPGSETQHVQNMQIMQQMNPEMHKDMQAKYIPGLGVARVAPTPADREQLTNLDEMDKGIAEAKNFASNVGTTLPLTANNQKAQDIQDRLQLSIGNLVKLKRINEFEAKKYTEMARNPGAWRTGAAIQSFDDLQRLSSDSKASLMKNLGVIPFQQQTSDQQALAWARSQPPGNPQAQQIIQLAGGR